MYKINKIYKNTLNYTISTDPGLENEQKMHTKSTNFYIKCINIIKLVKIYKIRVNYV